MTVLDGMGKDLQTDGERRGLLCYWTNRENSP
jgi:hypothetical protein